MMAIVMVLMVAVTLLVLSVVAVAIPMKGGVESRGWAKEGETLWEARGRLTAITRASRRCRSRCCRGKCSYCWWTTWRNCTWACFRGCV